MSVPASANPLLLRSAAPTSYQIQRSLRFNSADSAYLSRTPASAGNRKTWTWAGWVKRSNVLARGVFYGNVDSGANDGAWWLFESDDRLHIEDIGGGTYVRYMSSGVFRDTNAWMHLCIACDTTQATAADRFKVYINGAAHPALGSSTLPPLNYDMAINTTRTLGLGRAGLYATLTFPGYLADIHFIDGQALDPTSFGEFDANGIWQPKAFSGSYGTNGFRLDFADNASTTTIGYDAAGSNDWTANNLSVTAGSGNDSLVDSPTSYGTDTGAGGEVRGNYATLNPLDKNASATLTNGNLDFYNAASSHYLVRSTFGITSGKWYWEATIPSDASSPANFCAGICRSTHNLGLYVGGESSGWGLLGNGNTQNSAGSSYTTALALGDVIGIAFDADAGKIWWSKNGSYPNSGNPATGANAPYTNVTVGGGPYFPAVSAYQSAAIFNAGARPFAYTAPSGFKALNTANLPTPTIAKGSDYFDTKLYTGNGSSQTISGLGFSPDLIWMKIRNKAYDHRLIDVVRGGNKTLYSSLTNAEATETDTITAFNSDGWTMGGNIGINESSSTFAAWAWDAGSSTVTNTSGTISSQVRANASAGFSICTFTTQSSGTATCGHGLGVAPAFIIQKIRSVGSSSWFIYHSSLGSDKYILFDTAASVTSSAAWNNTAPTSTVWSLGSTWAGSYTTVSYCFAPVTGYSAFGSYTGNGSADGPFVYTGFRSRFLLYKRSDVANDWYILDTLRDPYNVTTQRLLPNSSASEYTYTTTDLIDVTANGFKIRSSNAAINTNGGTYVWAAFAENPFSLARAR